MVTWHKIHWLKNNMVFKSIQFFLHISMLFSKQFALIGHQFCLCLLYVPQQIGYEINSRTLLNGTYCTQCWELLIVFCNGNLTQNSLVEKQYGIQKDTNVLHKNNIVFKNTQMFCLFPWCPPLNFLSLDTDFVSEKDTTFFIFPLCSPKNLLSLDTNFVSVSYMFRSNMVMKLIAERFLMVHIVHNAESF